MESTCHNFLVRQKFISCLKYTYYTYVYMLFYYKSFPTTFDKDLRKNIKKNWRDGEIGEYKLNEMGALNMKYKK